MTNEEESEFEPGQHVRYLGNDKTVLRVSAVEPRILCKEGHPPKWGGRTNWFYSDEIVAVSPNEQGGSA